MVETADVQGRLTVGEAVTEFRQRRLPIAAYLAGYSALIRALDLPVPLHHEMVAVAPRNSQRKENGWRIVPIALKPADDVVSHLIFALKYEGVQLLTLKFVFQSMRQIDLEKAAEGRPTSSYVRRLCCFYEWLTDRTLGIPDARAGAYVDAIDTRQQYAGEKYLFSRRFKIRDNLPGSAAFCPLTHRTHEIDRLIGLDLAGRAQGIIEGAPKELLSRAAAFLLLSDSKTSFAIEGETPPKDRIARWGWTIGKAGQIALSVDELVKLQRELIGDARFVSAGHRDLPDLLESVRLTLKHSFNVSRWTASHVSSWRMSATA